MKKILWAIPMLIIVRWSEWYYKRYVGEMMEYDDED